MCVVASGAASLCGLQDAAASREPTWLGLRQRLRHGLVRPPQKAHMPCKAHTAYRKALAARTPCANRHWVCGWLALTASATCCCRYGITPWLEITFTILPPLPAQLLQAVRSAQAEGGEIGESSAWGQPCARASSGAAW